MKTNSKKHPVFSYLISCMDEELETTEQKIEEVLNAFNEEFNFTNNKKRYPNLQCRFAEWLQGAPSALSIDFYNDDILKLAVSWGSISQNATERQEQKILDNYYNFMSCKFFQLCKQNKIEYSQLY